MRNIFDQYSQPENKITHALASALNEDSKLLKSFIKEFGHKGYNLRALEIVEQKLPGEIQTSEKEAERRGLPDAWIYDDDNWSLLIESKVQAKLTKDQLNRHYKTAIRRGFDNVLVLAIDAKKPTIKLPEFCKLIYWSEIYTWLIKQSNAESNKPDWAWQVARYFEVAESQFTEDKYLTEGTLTTFTGLSFNTSTPYNYHEAKRVLKLLMNELKKEKRLEKELGINLSSNGRGAITGKASESVWDFISLKEADESDNHTAYPHFTISISRERLFALVTMPNGIKSEFRNNIIKPGYEHFHRVLEEVTNNFNKVLKLEGNAVPTIEILQRRYKTQRSTPNVDAKLVYDLRTAFNHEETPVKQQNGWLETTYQVLNPKKANTQLAIGMVFNYDQCSLVNSKDILNAIVQSWIACKPFIKNLLKK